MRQSDAPFVAVLAAVVEAESRSGLEPRLAAGERADAQFRPLQIRDDGERAFGVRLDFADGRMQRRHALMVPVAEIEAEGVRPRVAQRRDALAPPGGGAERRQYLRTPGAPARRHAAPSPDTRMTRKSLTLVNVGPVTSRSPRAAKTP